MDKSQEANAPPNPSFQEQSTPYPQPPPVYPQLPPAPADGGQQIPQQQVIVAVPTSFGRDPVSMQCPHCKEQIQTSTKSKSGKVAWLIGLGLFGLGFIVGFTWCCCCIPCCIDQLKEVEHSCPNKYCNQFLGRYKGSL